MLGFLIGANTKQTTEVIDVWRGVYSVCWFGAVIAVIDVTDVIYCGVLYSIQYCWYEDTIDVIDVINVIDVVNTVHVIIEFIGLYKLLVFL